MRGLLKASLLLAPVLAAAVFMDPKLALHLVSSETISDRSLATTIEVEVVSKYDDWKVILPFRLDVLPSPDPCGFGSITINGQFLPQTLDGVASRDIGPIITERNNVIIGTWDMTCIKSDGQSDSQLLIFTVNFLDGKPTLASGFTAHFRQTGVAQILSVGTDLSNLAQGPPDPEVETLPPAGDGDDKDITQFCIEQEIDDLHWLRARQRELEFLISAKEEAIAEYILPHTNNDIQSCGSLRCIAAAVACKARKAARRILNRIQGHHVEPEYSIYPYEAHELVHFPKVKTSQHGKDGNHTAPPYYWRPNHKTPPICRSPPTPKDDGPSGNLHPHSPPSPPLHSEGSHGPQIFEAEAPFRLSKSEVSPTDPPDYPSSGLKPNHHGLGHVFRVSKIGVIGVVLCLFVIALHRRACTTTNNRADRRARREERHRRRALRRSAYRKALTSFLARLSRNSPEDDRDYEEKRQALLATAEDGMLNAMDEEITEFRNAAGIVDDLVAESTRRSYPFSILNTSTASLLNFGSIVSERDYDISSQVGDVEGFPASAINDGSQMSSVSADGSRYTPGSTEYSPAHSSAGSVSDTRMLGPGTK